MLVRCVCVGKPWLPCHAFVPTRCEAVRSSSQPRCTMPRNHHHPPPHLQRHTLRTALGVSPNHHQHHHPGIHRHTSTSIHIHAGLCCAPHAYLAMSPPMLCPTTETRVSPGWRATTSSISLASRSPQASMPSNVLEYSFTRETCSSVLRASSWPRRHVAITRQFPALPNRPCTCGRAGRLVGAAGRRASAAPHTSSAHTCAPERATQEFSAAAASAAHQEDHVALGRVWRQQPGV